MTRERAIQILKMNEQEKWRSGVTAEEEKEAFAMAIEALNRPHGEWWACTKEGLPLTDLQCRCEPKKWYGFKCSHCTFIYKGNALTQSPYCQNCGADMREGEKK